MSAHKHHEAEPVVEASRPTERHWRAHGKALTPLYVKTLVQAAWTISWRARKSVMTRW